MHHQKKNHSPKKITPQKNHQQKKNHPPKKKNHFFTFYLWSRCWYGRVWITSGTMMSAESNKFDKKLAEWKCTTRARSSSFFLFIYLFTYKQFFWSGMGTTKRKNVKRFSFFFLTLCTVFFWSGMDTPSFPSDQHTLVIVAASRACRFARRADSKHRRNRTEGHCRHRPNAKIVWVKCVPWYSWYSRNLCCHASSNSAIQSGPGRCFILARDKTMLESIFGLYVFFFFFLHNGTAQGR